MCIHRFTRSPLRNPFHPGLRWVSRFDPVALERRTAPASLLLAGDSAGANQAPTAVRGDGGGAAMGGGEVEDETSG